MANAKNSPALFIVSCEDADALFAVYADNKREANFQVTTMVKDHISAIEDAETDGESPPDVPASVRRIIALRNGMKKKQRIGAMFKSELQLELGDSSV